MEKIFFSKNTLQEKRKIIYMLLIAFFSTFLIAFMMSSEKGANAVKSLYGGQVLGTTTGEYWDVSNEEELCEELGEIDKVAVIGDSLSNNTPENNYMPDASLNLSYAGYATYDLVNSLVFETDFQTKNFSTYDYAMIMFGANDCTYSETGGKSGEAASNYTTDKFEANLTKIVDAVMKNATVDQILAENYAGQGTLPILSTFPLREGFTDCNEESYNSIIRKVANEKGLPLRDLEKASDILDTRDTLHLDEAGNQKVNDITNELCGGIQKTNDEGEDDEENNGTKSGGSTTDEDESKSGSSSGKVGPTGATEDDYCDILGIEFGVDTDDSVRVMNEPANSKYFEYELGVVTYVEPSFDGICGNLKSMASNPVGYFSGKKGDISSVKSRTNADRHVIRLVNGSVSSGCSISATETAKVIEGIVKVFGSEIGSTVFVMPANEPLTELEAVRGGTGDAGTKDGQWMWTIVDYLHKSGVPGAADTSSYLIFPSFNMHDTNQAGYANTFLSTYSNSGGDLNGDFNSFGISTQIGGGRSDFSSVISEFRTILEKNGVREGYKLDLFGASSINDESFSGWVDLLTQAIKDHIDAMVGVHIFTPWGWMFDPLIKNYPIPADVWDDLFEECQEDSQYACITTKLKDIEGIENCNDPESSGVNGDVIVKIGEDGSRFAMPIITQQVELTLLGWLGNNNNIEQTNNPDYEGPVYGTYTNQYLAPCAADKVSITEKDLLLSKQFSGPIRMYYDEEDDSDAFDYQMSLLGNAMACMIYDLSYSRGTMSMTKLEPRFQTDAGEEIEVTDVGAGFLYESVSTLKNSTENIKEWIAQLATKLKEPDDACSEDIYTRVEPSDAVLGTELVTQEMYMDFTDDYILCAAIQQGSVYIDIPYYEYNPEGAFTQFCKPGGDTGYTYSGPDLLRYRALKGGVKRSELLGGYQAMAQLFEDEAKWNPWKSYEVQHNDKAAIKAKFSQKMYDYNSNEETDFSDPMSTVGEDSCSMDVYDRESDKDLMDTGNSEFIYPYVGQTLNIMKRIHRIFSLYTDEGGFVDEGEAKKYLEYRADEMQKFKDTAGEDDLIPSTMYGEILRAVLHPDYIYLCEDIDDISKLSYNTDDDTRRKNPDDTFAEDFADILTRVDCLMPANDPAAKDPMAEWLCDNDYLSSQYCMEDEYECIEPDVAEKLEKEKASLANMKGEMSWPAEGTISQEYYINQGGKTHPGIDIANSGANTPVYAAAAGKVKFIREHVTGSSKNLADFDNISYNDDYPPEYGNMVVIQHEDYYTIYAHLTQGSVIVNIGDDIVQGQQLATMGTTGWSTGNHLHFEIRTQTQNQSMCADYNSPDCTVNPEDYLEYPPGSEGDTSKENWEDLPLCEIDEEPEAMEFDNMCRMLDYVEEQTGVCAQILAVQAYSESSATVQLEGEKQRYYSDPYDQSKVENNQACLRSIYNGGGCDCRGPLQFCTSFSPYEVILNSEGIYETKKDSNGNVVYEEGNCKGYNTWGYYGWPDDGQNQTPLEIEPEKGQCIENGQVMFQGWDSLSSKGRAYDFTLDCVQDLGMDYEDGDYMDRTLFGPAICATAARFNEQNRAEIAQGQDTCTELNMRNFSHYMYGPSVSPQDPDLLGYQGAMVELFKKFSDEEEWENCTWFIND